MLTVKRPLFWATRVIEKGRTEESKRKRERGFDFLFLFNTGLQFPTGISLMNCLEQGRAPTESNLP